MAAERPSMTAHRDYTGSLEDINGLAAANDQILTADELNTSLLAILAAHADLLDSAELRWSVGYTLRNAWVIGADGAKVSYHAAAAATEAQIATTTPGDDSLVWVLSDTFDNSALLVRMLTAEGDITANAVAQALAAATAQAAAEAAQSDAATGIAAAATAQEAAEAAQSAADTGITNAATAEATAAAAVTEATNARDAATMAADSAEVLASGVPEKVVEQFRPSVNLIDKTTIRQGRQASPASREIITSNSSRCTAHILVEEGKTYILTGGSNASVFLFADQTDTSYVGAGIYGTPGFLIPSGVKYVVCNVTNQGETNTAGDDTVMLRQGATIEAYVPYVAPATEIETKITQVADAVPAKIDESAWYKYVVSDDGSHLAAKLPRYQKKALLRNDDLTICMVGTSLTARTAEHCTNHVNAKTRPPLCHANSIASHVWDRVKWDGQEYRRYDSGYFTLTGTWVAPLYEHATWDDSIYREGWTKYAYTQAASISCQIPAEAYAFRFIYRASSTATIGAVLAIAEGNGLVEVYDELTSAWIEANGYTFNQKEPAPVERTVSVPWAETGQFTDYTLASKGNTTYQKRLKMRCRSDLINSIGTPKTFTINKNVSGYLTCWGVEWSVREHMVTLINAARGSHHTQAGNSTGLPRYQDNEIWSFKPDLMFFELPIHNDGADDGQVKHASYWAHLTENYVFRDDYELSMKTRAAYFGLDPEIAMYSSSMSWNFGGITDDGKLVYGQSTDFEGEKGRVMSSLDKYQEAYDYVTSTYPDAVFINAARRWYDAAIAIHGDLKTATVASGRTGKTFTNEGSHWNDTGTKIIAKAILPALAVTHSNAISLLNVMGNGLSTYADDAAAGAAGLQSGRPYLRTGGVLAVKL